MRKVERMSGVSALKTGVVDLGSILFIIGGVVGFVMTILNIPIPTIYPLRLPTSFNTVFLVALTIGLVCSLGAINCYSLSSKRRLSEAGIRGTIFGLLLLIFSLGLFRGYQDPGTLNLFLVSAILILVAGTICFALRDSVVSAPA